MAESANSVVPPAGISLADDCETIPPDAAEALRWLGAWRAGPAIEAYAGPLPGVLAEIDRLIGRRLTLTFLKEFGGTRVYFPLPGALSNSHRIQRVIGGAAALTLVRRLGGAEMIAIPSGPLHVTWMRAVAIRALLMHGQHSISDIARRCSATERTVYNHQALLVGFGVLTVRSQRRRARPAALGLVSLLLAEDTRPEEIARQLDIPLAEIERQAALMQRRAPKARPR